MSAAELKLDVHSPRFRSPRARAYLVIALLEVRDGEAELARALLRRACQLDDDDIGTLRVPLHLVPSPVLRVVNDARRITLPNGDVQDFSRRGPLRLMLWALAAAASAGDDCLSVEDLVTAGYPGERITAESGRMRVHTAIRRLRNLGFDDMLLTRDEGYLLDPSLTVELDDSAKV